VIALKIEDESDFVMINTQLLHSVLEIWYDMILIIIIKIIFT